MRRGKGNETQRCGIGQTGDTTRNGAHMCVCVCVCELHRIPRCDGTVHPDSKTTKNIPAGTTTATIYAERHSSVAQFKTAKGEEGTHMIVLASAPAVPPAAKLFNISIKF